MTAPAPLRIRCKTIDEARRIVSLMLSRGVPSSAIGVLSAEPIHDVGVSISRRSRLPVFTLSGAVIGAASGFALASVTASLYPLNTGGMPMVSLLPVGIVTYESMMLLAILFTLAGLLLESRLLRRQPAEAVEYTQDIADGEIHVLAHITSAELAGEIVAAADAGRRIDG